MDTSNLIGSDHTGIYCVNREESLKFYRDILGFEILFSSDMPEPHNMNLTFIKKGSLTIELLTPIGSKEGILESAGASLNHMAIECKNIDKVVCELSELGYQFEMEEACPVNDFGAPPHSIKINFLRGPSGERIELFEHL